MEQEIIPYAYEENSSRSQMAWRTGTEAYNLTKAKSKFIREMDNSSRKRGHYINVQSSKDLVPETDDPLRESFKGGTKPLVLVEQGIRSATKERVESGTSGESFIIFCCNMFTTHVN